LATVTPGRGDSGRTGFWRRVDSPQFVVLIAAFLYLAFLAARLEKHHGDASFFVTAGDLLVDGNAPKSLTVLKANTGYDGEFYYRLALDPFTSERTAFGITFDSPRYRQQRILYPLIAWALSLGRPEAVPWVLIAVNYAALCAIAWLGGAYARHAGRHALWGMAFPLYAGFLLTLSRDLTEIVEVCCVLGAVHSVRRGRQWWGAGLLTLAILAKETALLVAAGAFLAWLAGRRRPSVEVKPQVFLVPFAVFAVWQTWLVWTWGSGPAKEIQSNVGLPLASFAPFVAEVFGVTGAFRLKTSIEVFLILLLIGSAAFALRSTRGMRLEKASWLLYSALVVSLTRSVWCEDWAFFRAFSECYLFGAMILLFAARAVGATVISFWLAGWIALALIVLKH
jgi:hypothetical protein